MNEKEILEIYLNGRLFMYQMMHTVFSGVPDDMLLDVLQSEEAKKVIEVFMEEGDSLSKVAQLLSELPLKRKADNDYLEKVKQEYMKLLIGPGRLLVYPWASTFLSREKMLFQESTLWVRHRYEDYGFLPKEFKKVADDHIALELHFMAKLSESALKAYEENNQRALSHYLMGQKQFLKEHMLLWIPQYADKLQELETALLYPQIAQMVKEFITMDAEFIEEVLNQ